MYKAVVDNPSKRRTRKRVWKALKKYVKSQTNAGGDSNILGRLAEWAS